MSAKTPGASASKTMTARISACRPQNNLTILPFTNAIPSATKTGIRSTSRRCFSSYDCRTMPKTIKIVSRNQMTPAQGIISRLFEITQTRSAIPTIRTSPRTTCPRLTLIKFAFKNASTKFKQTAAQARPAAIASDDRKPSRLRFRRNCESEVIQSRRQTADGPDVISTVGEWASPTLSAQIQ